MNREDLMLYILTLMILFGLLGYGLWQVYLGYVQFGPAAMAAWGDPWFTAAAWAAIPFFLLTIRAVVLARREVLVMKQGLVFNGMGKKPLAWNNLQGVAVEDIRYHLLTMTLRTRRRVTLFPTTGTSISLDDRFHDLSELAEKIKTHLYPLLVPELQKQLQANQWVYFGPLRLNHNELDTGKQTCPWEQITSLRVHTGFLRIERTGLRPLQIPSAKIPNVELLLQLVDEMYTGT